MKKIDFLAAAHTECLDQEKGRARLLSCLEWIYRWRYSTPELLRTLLGIKNNHHYKLITSWEKNGFIRRVKTAHLRFRHLVIITQKGAEFLQAYYSSTISSPMVDRTKISVTGIQHCIATQSFALNLINTDTIFQSEHELRLHQRAGEKVPDFVFCGKDSSKVAVEIELSAKTNEQTEIAFSHSINSLNEGVFNHLIYASTSKAILRRYEKLGKKTSINLWVRDSMQRKWLRDNNTQLSPVYFKSNIDYRFDLVNYFKQFIG